MSSLAQELLEEGYILVDARGTGAAQADRLKKAGFDNVAWVNDVKEAFSERN